jgi:hypothetical protein
MRQDTGIQQLSNSEYFDSLLNGECGGGELEVHAASILHNWNISVHDAGSKSVFTFTKGCPVLNVTLEKSGDYYAVKMFY